MQDDGLLRCDGGLEFCYLAESYQVPAGTPGSEVGPSPNQFDSRRSAVGQSICSWEYRAPRNEAPSYELWTAAPLARPRPWPCHLHGSTPPPRRLEPRPRTAPTSPHSSACVSDTRAGSFYSAPESSSSTAPFCEAPPASLMHPPRPRLASSSATNSSAIDM